MVMRMYNTLAPNDPMRNQLVGNYQRWKQEITPGWRKILDLDNLEKGGMFVAQ
jgi:hypothetical protein